MIHIVFQESDKIALSKSFELDPSLSADIYFFQDDYAVGPIQDLFEMQGIEARKQWWKQVLAGTDLESKPYTDEVNDRKTLISIQKVLDENPEEVIWIWAAQNKHDVSGYYWLISQLKEYQSRVYILYLNNLPFINAKGNIFYPSWLFEIEPKEFLKAKKLARPVTLSEFEIDPDEWTRLSNESKGVRILEGGKKLIQFDYDHYDKELLKFITPEFQKVNKLMNTFLSKSPNTTGDMFLLWRLKTLISQGVLEPQGNIKNIKDFDVKLKSVEEVYG